MIEQVAFTILSLLYLVTPLIFSTVSTELFEFPKMLTLYAGAALLLPLCIYKLYLLLRSRIKSKSISQIFLPLLTTNYYLLTTFLLFLLSQTVSTMFSIDRNTSFFGYYTRFNGGLLSLFTYFILFVSTLLFVSKDKVNWLLRIIVLGVVLTALWGLSSHFGKDFICLAATGKWDTNCWTKDFIPTERMFSTLGQPNWFATYVLIGIFIVLYVYTTGSSLMNKKFEQIERFIQPLLFFLFSIELVWTKSRSGIFSGIVFIGVFFITISILKLKTARPLVPFVICYLFFVILASYPLWSGLIKVDVNAQGITIVPDQVFPTASVWKPTPVPPVVQPPSSSRSATNSTEIRRYVWEGALKLGLKYPLFGTGVETFAYAYNFTRPSGHNLTSEWDFVYNKAHNELLNFFATTGFFGLISYVLMFTAFLLPAIFYLINSKFKYTNIQKKSSVQNSILHSDFEFRISNLMLFCVSYLMLMLSIFTTNFFGFSTTVTNLFFYTFPALFIVSIPKSSPSSTTTNLPFTNYNLLPTSYPPTPKLLIVCYLLFGICSASYLSNYFQADLAFAKSKAYRANNEVLNAYQETQKALSIREEPVYMDQQSYIAVNLAASLKLQKQNVHAAELERRAKYYSDTSISGSMQNMYYYRTRAKTYYILSIAHLEDRVLSKEYYEEAVAALSKAIDIAPTEPKNMYTLASLIVENEPKRAKKLLTRALKLKPDYLPAQELQEKLKK